MPIWLAVALGGAGGSLARWQIGLWCRAQGWQFPMATLLVNVLGSFAIGFCAGWFMARPVPEWVRLGVITGVLGGYTTFSAFSLETVELIRTQPSMAVLNIALQLMLGLSACFAGMLLARQITAA